jgi:SAM-dependent methyltransferase
MNNKLEHIINKIKSEGKDYSDFRVLLAEIEESGVAIPKDELSEFLNNDFRIQLHTTPNSVAKLIAHIAHSLNAKSVLDVCCGTGNILYFLQNNIDDLTGIEIKEDIAVLTKHYMPDLKIITADTFQYPFTKTYDLVVGNLPWGPPIDNNGKRQKLEEAFLRKSFELCEDKGDIIIVVPYHVLNNGALEALREEFKLSLKKIIGLPSGLIRHSGIKTALLHLKKNGSEFVKIGIVENLKDLENSLSELLKVELKTSAIEDRWDPEYYIGHQDIDEKLSTHDTKELSELAEIISGRPIKKDQLSSKGDYLYLRPSNIKEGKLQISESSMFIHESDINERHKTAIAQPSDIIISTIFNTLKLYIVKEDDPPLFVSNNMAIIRSSFDDYILSYLKSEHGKALFSRQAKRLRKGVVIPHVTLKDLRGIQIPILPLSSLNSVGDKAIEHASKSDLENLKTLLENYKKENTQLKSENEDLKAKDSFADNRLFKIEKQLELLNLKVDTLLDLVKDLTTDFSKIKNLPREDEEKLFKLCQSIDQKMEKVLEAETTTIENYVEETKRWLHLWELLNEDSKKFLPIAELIFDELSQLKEADFSPFIVQYCRTFENEILKKLFESYHLKGLTEVTIEDLVKEDIANNTKAMKFAKMVKSNKLTYTLGDMNFIMALLSPNGNTLKQSQLLQHFRSFVCQYFEDNILDKNFLTDLNNITSNYRNKAAHPHILDLVIAMECQKLIRKNLNLFLEAKK